MCPGSCLWRRLDGLGVPLGRLSGKWLPAGSPWDRCVGRELSALLCQVLGSGGGQTVGCGFLACPALSMKDKYSTKAQGAGLPGWSRGHGPWRPQRGQSFPTAK